jgi:uncharacterized protein (TIGR01777 family)
MRPANEAKWKDEPPRRIAITGASGLIGSKLRAFLSTAGHTVASVTRSNPEPGDILWSPTENQIDADAFEGHDAVIHLAGENLFSLRWTKSKKQKIMDSRVCGTRRLAESLAKLKNKPRVLICASATGYYGHQGEKILTEESPNGQGFLAEVCRQWEAAADAARRAGIRVVHMRTGVVLTPKGGALRLMITPFKLGLGAAIGSGEQYLSWITPDDLVGLFYEAIFNARITGALNATAPEPVTNKEFTRALGRVLNRPTPLSIPAIAPKFFLGEMADEMILHGQRAVPQKALNQGFAFQYPDLESALGGVLDG